MNIILIEVVLVILALLFSYLIITADNSQLLCRDVPSTIVNNDVITLLLPILALWVLISFVFAHFISKIGAKRNIGSKASFWYSFLFGPLIGLIIVLNSEETK